MTDAIASKEPFKAKPTPRYHYTLLGELARLTVRIGATDENEGVGATTLVDKEDEEYLVEAISTTSWDVMSQVEGSKGVAGRRLGQFSREF